MLAAKIGRVERLPRFIADVQPPNAFGRVDFMPTDRERVDIGEGEGRFQPALHRIDVHARAVVECLYPCGKALDRIAHARFVVHEHTGDEHRALVYLREHIFHRQDAIRARLYHHHVVAFGSKACDGQLHTGVLEARYDNFFAEFFAFRKP